MGLTNESTKTSFTQSGRILLFSLRNQTAKMRLIRNGFYRIYIYTNVYDIN